MIIKTNIKNNIKIFQQNKKQTTQNIINNLSLMKYKILSLEFK